MTVQKRMLSKQLFFLSSVSIGGSCSRFLAKGAAGVFRTAFRLAAEPSEQAQV